MRILITGASGKIGSTLADVLKDKYTLRLADLDLSGLYLYEGTHHEVMKLNVADLEACQQACKDIDLVIHLAADPSPHAGFYESIAVRIGVNDALPPADGQLTARDMSAYLHPRDLCDLIEKTILTEELPPFTILHGISDNRFKRLDLTETKKRVGYEPKADDFQLSKIPLHDEPR